MMKNQKKTIVLVISAFAVCIAALCLWLAFRPLAPAICVDALEQRFHYLPAEECAFSQWERTCQSPKGELILQIEPQEALVLSFWSDGMVVVSDGYARPILERSVVTYQVPEKTIDAILLHYANT